MRSITAILAILALNGLSQDHSIDGDTQVLGTAEHRQTTTSGLLRAQVLDAAEDHREFLHHDNWLAPFVPTPADVVDAVLALADVGKNDVVYDLGSGDGRIIIAAAQKIGARAVGIEWNEALCQETSLAISKLQLSSRAKVICGDIFEQDLSSATVVTIYLLPKSLQRLAPVLEQQLQNGARIVSIDYKIPGWSAIRKKTVIANSDKKPRELYLYHFSKH